MNNFEIFKVIIQPFLIGINRKGRFFMNNFEILDANNRKALNVVHTALVFLDNGLEGMDIVEILEVVRDYLKINDKIFDAHS